VASRYNPDAAKTYFRVAGPLALIALVVLGITGVWYAWIALALVILVGVLHRFR
jgi:hypothetical protein